jgi:hypothetical protein
MSTIFNGNCNTSVTRQAKYRIKSNKNEYHIEIQIDTQDGYRIYPSTNEHPILVTMINEIKEKYSLAPGGQFYINEWRQVIVPVNTSPISYYYAGEYDKDLTFILDDVEYSGRPININGTSFQTVGTIIINFNQWINVTFTRNSSTNVNISYLNGVLKQQTTVASIISYYNQEVWIGRGNFGGYTTGNISACKFYNRALSALEVLQNYNATKGRHGL